MHPATPDDNPAAPSTARPHLDNLAAALGVRVHLGSGPYDLAVPVLDFLRSDLYRTVPGDITFNRGLDALREAVARAAFLADGLDENGKRWLAVDAEVNLQFYNFKEWALDGQPREPWQEAALAGAFVGFLAREVRAAARIRDIYCTGAAVLDCGNPSGFPSVTRVLLAEKGEPDEALPASPPARYLSVYSHEVLNGGPEEGGWTWHKKILRATFALPEPTDNFDPAAAPAELIAVARAAADALGLTLPGDSVPTRDGGTRPARPASSCAPEVDGVLVVEPFPGSDNCTAPDPWE